MIYNIANGGKETKLKSWIKTTIGEEPVLLDSVQTKKTLRQLQMYLYGKGYFKASVRDSIVRTNKKATVFYVISTDKPYTVRNKYFNIADPAINDIVKNDDANSLVKSGKNYDEELLQKERERITAELKNRGYYFFNKEYIYFQIDSALGNNQVDVFMGIKKVNENTASPEDHKVYSINNIYINTDYDPKLINDTIPKDTLEYKNCYFIYSKNNLLIKPEMLYSHIFIRKGDVFQLGNLDNTYKRLSDLGIYKFTNIKFIEKNRDTISPAQNLLDCFIQLTPSSKQNISVETEGTNKSGTLGIAGSVVYRNKNTFKGAELFEIKINGGVEAQKTFVKDGNTNNQLEQLGFNTLQISPEMNLNFHKFIVPFRLKNVSMYSNPKTILSTSYNYQQRPEYKRQIINLSFGYNWKESNYWRYYVYPLEINAVDIFQIDPDYNANLEKLGPTVRNSYNNHLIPSGKFSWLFNNQNNKNKSFIFFKANMETAGLTFWLSNSSVNYFNKDAQSVSYLVLGRKYSQYIKPDIDFRYYHVVDVHNTVAYRFISGIGIPWGNADALPFEKSFSAGGSNDIRAWRSRTLGPGSYRDTLHIEQTADIKLGGSVEYRFDLFKFLQGAAFVDAGNIWALQNDTNRQGVQFTKDFYKEVAVGAGLGIRLNFTFFIFRIDGAVPFKDPSFPEGKRWVIKNINDKGWKSDYEQQYGRSYPFLNLNFAIGYPF